MDTASVLEDQIQMEQMQNSINHSDAAAAVAAAEVLEVIVSEL